MIRTFRTLAPLAALMASPAAAGEFDAQMGAFLDAQVRSWANAPIIVEAIAAQNAETAGYDQPRIDELDTTWRGQVGSADTSLIDPVITGPVADFLRNQMEAMGGQVTEIILMDARGLNVACSGVTSDFWQGDEEKYTHTYAIGADGVHFGEIEFDESTQSYQAQISFTITDPASGSPIGAMTVAVDGEAFL